MRWSQRTGMLLVALAAFALYLPTLGYDFVYDSVPQIGMDDFIHQPRHFADVLTLRVMGMDVLDFNRPLNLLTLMVDSLFWGKNPAGYRLTNLLLHGAVAALLFRWLRRLAGHTGAALAAALCFAAHPLHVETVVEAGYREDLLATLFLLAGLNAAMAFEPGARGKTWLPAICTAGCLFLSAAAKESGVAGPVILLVYWGSLRWENRAAWRGWAALGAASAVLVGGFLALRFALEPKPSVIFTVPAHPIAAPGLDWLLAQSRIWCGEFLHIVWPAHLCADYGPYNLRNIDPALALIGIFALLIVQAGLAFWNGRAAVGCAVFWAALLPVSNLVPIYRPMADRYLYMPLVGVALLLALALAGIASRARRGVAGGALAAALLAACALAVATLRLQPAWKDDAALWAETVRENPLSLNGWLGRGYAALDRGEPGEALRFFEKAAGISQGSAAEPFAGMALAADALGQSAKAADALARATKLDSRYARPETLERALIYPADQIQHFLLIQRRTPAPL